MAPQAAKVIDTRSGRRLEFVEYGDPAGHPGFFFHGFIGSHYQASYINEQARAPGLRVLAPNRPGVGGSEFVRRRSVVEAVADVEDMAEALGLAEFSVIGISGGAPYALATLFRLAPRIRTATIVSGIGPTGLPRALHGMARSRRLLLEVGLRAPHLARGGLRVVAARFQADPARFLERLVATWSAPDRLLFRRPDVFELFLRDLHAVFTAGVGAEGLAQELTLYPGRRYGFSLHQLPGDRRITLWHGLDDAIVPPAMAWAMARALPNCEAHLVPGGHFVAVDVADQIIGRVMEHLGRAASR